MKQKLQNEHGRSNFKKLAMLMIALALVFMIAVALVACNNDNGQSNKPPIGNEPSIGDDDDNNSQPIQPVPPIEKTVTVDKIYEDSFAGTIFDEAIENAQIALAERVFGGLAPQITDISYNASSNRLTFEITYVENKREKSGSMSFVAPKLYQQMRSKQAKDVVFDFAELSANTEVKEAEIDEVKSQLSNAIQSVKQGISTAFGNVQVSDVSVEKQVEHLTFEDIYNEVFGEDYKLPRFEDLIYELLPKITTANKLQLLFTGFEGEDFYIYFTCANFLNVYSLRTLLYEGEHLEKFLYYRNSVDKLLHNEDETFCDALKNQINVSENYKRDSSEYEELISAMRELKSKIDDALNIIRSSDKSDFKSTYLMLKAINEYINHEDFAKKLFADNNVDTNDKEIIWVGVGGLSGRRIDRKYFNTGYYDSFWICTVYKDGENIVINKQKIVVPWYNNSTTEDLYNSFIIKGVYNIVDEETIIIENPMLCVWKEDK